MLYRDGWRVNRGGGDSGLGRQGKEALNIVEDTLALRRELAALATKPEWELLTRYDLLSKKQPSCFHDRVFRSVRKWLAATGVLPPHVTKYAWLPTLKHVPLAAEAKALLIWAPGVGRDELRQGCEGFSRRLKGNDSLAPVLVTDVADFAFFSRLGWLVEYLPGLSREGPSYHDRKRRYLAWRYRDAVAVPLSAGVAGEAEWQALLRIE
jgi:hypothetical protein